MTRISYESYLGLFRRSELVKPHTNVYVAPAPADALLDEDDNFVGDILCSVQRVVAAISADDEYSGSREYVPGMNVRRWDQASSARLNALIVREYQSESGGNVTLIVDDTVDATRSLPGTEDTQLEIVLTLCATLLEYFTTQRIRVSRVFTSDGVESLPDKASNDNDWVLRRLAGIVGTSSSIANCPGIDTHLNGETVILVTYAWRDECDTLATTVQRQGLHVIPVSVNRNGTEARDSATALSGGAP